MKKEEVTIVCEIWRKTLVSLLNYNWTRKYHNGQVMLVLYTKIKKIVEIFFVQMFKLYAVANVMGSSVMCMCIQKSIQKM